jgi:hypothetical protein
VKKTADCKQFLILKTQVFELDILRSYNKRLFFPCIWILQVVASDSVKLFKIRFYGDLEIEFFLKREQIKLYRFKRRISMWMKMSRVFGNALIL